MTLADLRAFDCLVPAGTPKTALVSFPLPLPSLLVPAWVEWRVPFGAAGQVGFWIGSHGQQVIPFGTGQTFIVAADESQHWDLDPGFFSWEDWQLQAYNLGGLDHNIYVRIGLNSPAAPTTTPALPSIAVLNS